MLKEEERKTNVLKSQMARRKDSRFYLMYDVLEKYRNTRLVTMTNNLFINKGAFSRKTAPKKKSRNVSKKISLKKFKDIFNTAVDNVEEETEEATENTKEINRMLSIKSPDPIAEKLFYSTLLSSSANRESRNFEGMSKELRNAKLIKDAYRQEELMLKYERDLRKVTTK
jgi:hypothetical protein